MIRDIDRFVRELTQEALGDAWSDSGKIQEAEPLEMVLKGHAIALWSDLLGERLFIAADEADAKVLGEPRGQIYMGDEVRCVVQITDPAIVAELHRWKRRFNGRIRGDKEGA